MPLHVLVLVLASAAIHALWNAMLKGSRDLDTASTGVFLTAMVASGVAGLLIPGTAFSGSVSLAWGLAAGLCEGCYFVGLVRSLERAPLGWGYAWMRGSSIALLWPVSIGFLGESCRPLSLAGVVCVCAGLGFLGSGPRAGRASGALAWALFTGFCIAAYNLCYKLSLAHGSQPLALFSLSMAVGLPVQVVVRLRRGSFHLLPERPGVVLAAGLLCALGFSLFLLALSEGGAGAVSTLRNTSVAFAMIFSLALGERPAPRQWLGAGLVALGAAGLGWR